MIGGGMHITHSGRIYQGFYKFENDHYYGR